MVWDGIIRTILEEPYQLAKYEDGIFLLYKINGEMYEYYEYNIDTGTIKQVESSYWEDLFG